MDFKVVSFEYEHSSDLIQDYAAAWYSYEAKRNNEKLYGYLIIEEGLSEEEIMIKIENHIEKIGFDNFVKINTLSHSLKDLIIECNGSDNEMFFVEENDHYWPNLSEEELKALIEEVDNKLNQRGHTNYIEFYEDGALITVYGGISEVVNFWEGVQIEEEY